MSFQNKTSAQNTTSLEAITVPALNITGPIGSLQEVQYSTNTANTNSWTTLSFVRLGASPTPFADVNATGDKRFYRTRMVNVADTNLVWIPPGTFTMGSPHTEEGRQTNENQVSVTLTKGFFMARFETRIIEWLDVMGGFPLAVVPSNETNLVNYLQRPVRNMFWGEATNYCFMRTQIDTAQQKIPSGWEYRLPTEAEWEYACRAGTSTTFSHGNQLRNDAIRQDAHFDGDFPYPANLVPLNPIHDFVNPVVVGNYRSNAFGLYDMHGNVAEWCLDRHPGPPDSLPGGQDPYTNNGGFRIVRGGEMLSSGAFCRSATRGTAVESANGRRGFRVVLAPR
jgi:formylglycine-generating enzyme required for sulfatase activity